MGKPRWDRSKESAWLTRWRQPSRARYGASVVSALVVLALVASTYVVAAPAPSDAGPLFGKPSQPAGMTNNYVTLPSGDTMQYTETGPATAKPILFVHGYPTSSYLWRDVIGEVCPSGQQQYRCLAIDLIGFGQSSCPGNGDIGPMYQADRVDEFINLMGLNDFAVVVHDWGGPIGLGAALRNTDRMSEMVILNTSLRMGSEGLLSPIMSFTNVITSGNMTLIERTYRSIVNFVMQSFTSTRLSWSERRQYTAPFTDWVSGDCRVAASLNLFAKANDSEPLYQEIETGLQASWAGRPALFLWGTEDLLMGPKTAIGVKAHNELASLLPQAETILIEGANHFMQEDRPGEIGREIKTFLQ